MRVLVALPYAPSLIRVRPYNLLKQLSRRHELSVLIVGPRPTERELELLSSMTDEVAWVSPSLGGIAWYCGSALLRGEPLQAAVNRTRAARRMLQALLEERHHDVVHVEHLRAAFLEQAIPVKMPRVFDSVDCISLLWERTKSDSHSRLRRLIAAMEHGATRRYEARLMSRFDRVAVTSPDDASALRELAQDAEVTVTPNGVDLDYFQPRPELRQPDTVVFSGKMSYHANVTAVLYFMREVLPRVRLTVPELRVRIVGSDPPKVLQDLAAVDPRLEVTGYLPDMRPAIGNASVAICPVTVKVGIQNKILEAMAMGVPVVASARGAAGLQAEIGRDLLVADNPDLFARSVTAVLRDEALRSRLTLAGRQYVERHHRWEAAATAFEDLYRQASEHRLEATRAAAPALSLT